MPSEKDTKINEAVEELSRRIAQGWYAAGQRLPSERELADKLKISRVTVRAALLRLQADNLIDVVPRGGAFVRSPGTRVAIASGPELKHSGSFVRAMEQQGRQTFVRFIEPSSIAPAGNEIGARMNIGPDTPVLRRYRIHLVDRVPYRILDSYYLASLLGDLLGEDEGYLPLFKWLREHTGVRASQVKERLNCRMPSAEEARLLNISRGQPVVDLGRWVWGDNDTLFEYTHMVANAALHEFSYSYDLSEEASQ